MSTSILFAVATFSVLALCHGKPCSEGNEFCQTTSGGSYCKYWQDIPRCQYSDLVCSCRDGSTTYAPFSGPATGPKCAVGDIYCQTTAGDSYCKWWQQPPLCQYSNVPCHCSLGSTSTTTSSAFTTDEINPDE